MVVRVLRDHLREVEAPGEGGGHRHADETARVGRHEVDVLRRRELGGANEVALVLALLVVRHDHDPARPELVENLGNC